MADGDEIADDFVADVGPSLEYFLGRRPGLVADLAGAEDIAATPASFDVLDVFEQLGGSASLSVYAAHFLGVGGDIAPTTALGVAEHDEEGAGDVDDLQMLPVLLSSGSADRGLSARM